MVLNTISWMAPPVLYDLEFYELHAIGRNSPSDDRMFRVLETFLSINMTTFEAVNITVQNKCGQRSETVTTMLLESDNLCEFYTILGMRNII